MPKRKISLKTPQWEGTLQKGVRTYVKGEWLRVENETNGMGSATGEATIYFPPPPPLPRGERTSMRASLTPTLTTPHVCLMADPRSLRALLTICGQGCLACSNNVPFCDRLLLLFHQTKTYPRRPYISVSNDFKLHRFPTQCYISSSHQIRLYFQE